MHIAQIRIRDPVIDGICMFLQITADRISQPGNSQLVDHIRAESFDDAHLFRRVRIIVARQKVFQKFRAAGQFPSS